MSYSLFELNEFIRQVLALNLGDSVWVRCELAQVKYSRGHCYLDLVQKDGSGTDIIAQSQAAIWSQQLRRIQKKLGLELDALLREGMEVMMQARVEFHERYGLKLIVEDFDPTYTLGKLELRRRETITALKKAGLLEKNARLTLPSVLQHIAILSSETAAGLQDFLEQLDKNNFGYRFNCQLFPTAMQGSNVADEIAIQLRKIIRQKAKFDAIVVIRGGGSKLDLAAFDDFAVCEQIANAPLPVLTGIGHDVDQTVTDMVAAISLKTPTAVAEFILQHNLNFESALLNAASLVKELAGEMIAVHQLQLQRLWQFIEIQTHNALRSQEMMLGFIKKEIPVLVNSRLEKETATLTLYEKTCQLLSPETVMKRGFSMTLQDGAIVSSADRLKAGDTIKTILYKGNFTSVVKKMENE